jgi:hypothetical protein
LPVSVLASFVLASVAVPLLPQWAGPLAVAQARKPQPADDTISDTSQTQRVVRSNTIAGSPRTRRQKDPRQLAGSSHVNVNGKEPSNTRPTRSSSLSRRPQSSETNTSAPRNPGESRRPPYINIESPEARLSSSSLPLPELRTPKGSPRPATPASASFTQRPIDFIQRRHSQHPRALSPSAMSRAQKIKLLRQNYFRCETQFLRALEDISNRLVIVPKPARLSALRAELALIAQDLPAEVDIPVICPATLVDGAPGKSKHHRIVRLNPSEATVLNSAEKVPYLLMVEVLRDDFSFNPDTSDNERLLSQLLVDQDSNRRRIFDLSDGPRHVPQVARNVDSAPDSVFEPVSGDLGSSPRIGSFEHDPLAEIGSKISTDSRKENSMPRLLSAATTMSSISLSPPRSSGPSNSRPVSPGPLRKMTFPMSTRTTTPDQPDFTALATHMRTASQMLAQLDSTSGKRPKSEVAAIRAKIIASMQSMEEQSFEADELVSAPSFDTILANANAKAAAVAVTATPESEEVEEEQTIDPSLTSGAGAARMENDQKTGGVQRKGDRDDPSAATFGEAWSVKKERIRKSSPYGWMKNWDLLSVIVKTGADLRQEAFACQLIRVCDKIWSDAGTPVWVKQMRILVTGESSGLIETITNGVSLHSLKRSLTLATVEAGQNPRARVATLKDHFIKTFGEPESKGYKAAEDAFKRSLAAYSMISYVLQLKDRHNGNVLIDNEGHIIHIDFGFMLSNSPGSVAFEAAPFKLTQDYVDVLGGVGSPAFDDYKKLCKQAFQGM